jgi:hypothetical protein
LPPASDEYENALTVELSKVHGCRQRLGPKPSSLPCPPDARQGSEDQLVRQRRIGGDPRAKHTRALLRGPLRDELMREPEPVTLVSREAATLVLPMCSENPDVRISRRFPVRLG